MALSKIKAFTIIELLTVVTIFGILAALTAPSFANIIKDNRMTTQYNDLLASLSFARSEAARRGLPVSVCKSSDQSSCGGNAVDWNDGWIIFVDDNGTADGILNGGEELVRAHDSLDSDNTLNYSQASIMYSNDGSILGSSNILFTMCDSRGDTNRKGLHVSPTGRVRHSIQTDILASCP